MQERIRQLSGITESKVDVASKKEWNVIMRMVANSTVDDMGYKPESTTKVGDKVHEFNLNGFTFHIIQVE